MHAAAARALDEELAYVSDVDEQAYSVQIRRDEVGYAISDLSLQDSLGGEGADQRKFVGVPNFTVSISHSTVGSMAVGNEAHSQGQVAHDVGGSSRPEGQAQTPTASPRSSVSMKPVDGAPIDFAILTAIEVERRAVCTAFGLGDNHRVKKGSRVYWRGKLPLKNGEFYELVVAQSPDMANVDAALLTSDMLHHWSPGAALMVGIAASGEPGEVKLGDLVAGRDVYYYERGKVTPSGTKPEPKMVPAEATLWGNVTALPDWEAELPVPRPGGGIIRPKLHFGVIASGEKVLADEAARDSIAAGHRKILAIEMEGYGFSRAVWQSFEQVRHLVIRGICDDGSPAKDDRWHAYAAGAAAGFAKHFLLDRPLSPRGASNPPRP
jgi:nucleoside phosphorylase